MERESDFLARLSQSSSDGLTSLPSPSSE